MVKKSAVKKPISIATRKSADTFPVLLGTHNATKQPTNSVVPFGEDWSHRPVIEISGAAIRNRLEFFEALEKKDKEHSTTSSIK